jgi:hypothetical protein
MVINIRIDTAKTPSCVYSIHAQVYFINQPILKYQFIFSLQTVRQLGNS